MPDQGGRDEGSTAKRAISGMVELTLAAFDKASPLRAAMLALALFDIVLVVLVVGLLTASQPLYALIALLAAFVLALLMIVLALRSQPHSPGVIEFDQQVPRRVLGSEITNAVGQLVEEIRSACLEEINKRPGESRPNTSVRANVFLPDYRPQMKGCAFELVMSKTMSREMTRPEEWELRFYPGEGATGAVFNQGVAKRVRNLEFLATDRNKKLVHPELKWIVSSPIKGAKGTTLAVLNVDGIGFDLDESILEVVQSVVAAKLDALGKALDQGPKTRLFVTHVDLESSASQERPDQGEGA